ncbi:unnamed protein product [Bursaphelenchus xylophilus]|uniref:(pine wood nematode) hypothetical protein n=1 Tax=Bursaphelenchus xylophilus TaxID=6326 RepID=A0A1I7RIX3_BURXY|nr:unnamed protein product [Bursaphelenchus xylophilus]CAG9119154.1 unnamed protein product [Bursaphelenchus xylophilus]
MTGSGWLRFVYGVVLLCTILAADVPDFPDNEPFEAFDFGGGPEPTPEKEVVAEQDFPIQTQSPTKPGNSQTALKEMGLCEHPDELPTFIKRSKVQSKGIPKFVHFMDNLAECVQVCRRKTEPIEQTPFDCKGFVFNHRAHGKNSCEFFDDITLIEPITNDMKWENQSTFFERACLKIPGKCGESAYSIESIPNKKLGLTPLESVNVRDQAECLNECLTSSACKSVNYNAKDRYCELLTTSSSGGLLEATGFEFFENICLQDSNKCSARERVDFIVSKNTQVSGLEHRVGSVSIQTCMRECVESSLVHCRSFQYDQNNRECVLMEESSHSATASEIFDLFEPVCLDGDIDLPCQGDYVFEKVLNTNLVAEDLISIEKEATVASCMQKCLNNENCLSFTFNKLERKCKILPVNRKHTQTKAIVENYFDFYELSCDRQAILKNQQPVIEVNRDSGDTTAANLTTFPITTTPAQKSTTHPVHGNACDSTKSVLIEKGRTLRIEYRNLHHVNIKTIEICEGLCQGTTIACQTFAYNERTGDCLLSTLMIDKNNRFFFVTQPNPSYELYAFLGRACEQTTAPPTPLPTLISLPPTYTTPQYIHKVEEFTATMILIDKDAVATTIDPVDVDPFDENDKPKHRHHHKVSKIPHIPTSASFQEFRDQQVDDFHMFPAPPDEKSVKSAKKTTASPLAKTDVPRRDKTLEKFAPNQIKVNAFCLEGGVNVTFQVTDKKYNGAVYAAERFGQCRAFVEMASVFSIFVARPGVNNNCNAFEEDGILTAVLVMSNDMVLPYDVTTKDDFFYQITCDYSKGEHASIVRTGIVVGGPEPRSIMTNGKKAEDTETKVILRILKNHRPVTNVYIGEKLTAVVESDIDASRLKVSDCNATRVGGREPKPNSVTLIKDGCSLMPQIMGNIVKGENGLEAPFTAFRIDGSDQIDIVCSVVVCKAKCDEKEPSCPPTRPKRAIDSRRGDDKITVDQRLRVLVVDDSTIDSETGKYSSPGVLGLLLGSEKNPYCVNSTVLLSLISMCVLSLIALTISASWFFCQRRQTYPPQPMYSEQFRGSDLPPPPPAFHIPRVERYVA